MNKPTLFSSAKAATLIAVGVIGATALTGFAFAANSTPDPSTGSTPSATAPADPAQDAGKGPRDGRGGPGGVFGRMGPNGPVLHGDVTVKDKEGVVKNVRIQTGVVTAVSATSLTLKSSDDYVGEWTVNSDTKVRRDKEQATIDKVAVGDTVTVMGTVVSDTATAERVHAFTKEGLAAAEKDRAARQQNKADAGNGQGGPGQGGQEMGGPGMGGPGMTDGAGPDAPPASPGAANSSSTNPANDTTA
ncbi:MAG: hypothetical protein NTU50_01020 [Actinobacteria bacterium]|nr:hypothetical protein [Actinomycetota bacterium]